MILRLRHIRTLPMHLISDTGRLFSRTGPGGGDSLRVHGLVLKLCDSAWRQTPDRRRMLNPVPVHVCSRVPEKFGKPLEVSLGR